MKTWLLVGMVGMGALMAGCNRNADNSGSSSSSMVSTNESMTQQAESNVLSATSRASNTASSLYSGDTNVATNAGPDNTARNVRDRSTNMLTPGDQGESAADIETTQKIRQAVVKDPALSTTAKNIKIITANGKVTLRGPVNSAEEKQAIEAIAQSTAGGATVDDQLEVKSGNQ
ncbi:MAG: osmy [Pedosphaera sp.]|nr:osmy [Pedosphaera sp.]